MLANPRCKITNMRKIHTETDMPDVYEFVSFTSICKERRETTKQKENSCLCVYYAYLYAFSLLYPIENSTSFSTF